MKYESDILKRLINTYGVVGNPRYISEIIKEFIVRGKERFPELFTYQSDWLAHIDEFGLNPTYTVTYTGQSIYAPNTLERPVKRAILSGSTKYRDIDTGEFLETFEEYRNLELASVKMPVLTTSNEDGTKTNILTTPSDLELRGIGSVQDTLDCLTGEVTERIREIVLNGGEEWSITINFSNGDCKAYSLSVNGLTSNIVCDGLKILPNSLKYATEEGVFTNNNLLIVKKNIETRELLKQWLSQNPITVQYQLATESVKTVDLSVKDQDNQVINQLSTFEGGTHFTTSSQEGSLLPSLTVDVVTNLEETLKVCSLEGNTM